MEHKSTVVCVPLDGAGFTDNIRGAISIYKVCKSLGLRFKIHITEPFKLTEYLLPNNYDWEVTPEEFAAAMQENNVCRFVVQFNGSLGEEDEINAKCQGHRYLIVKSNVLSAREDEYSELFNELFHPTAYLQEAIDMHLRQIGGSFVSASFRFMQLFGDFVEAAYCQNAVVLEPPARKALLARCLEHLEDVHKEHPNKKILVTSDSISFLTAALKLSYVYVVPGGMVHFANRNIHSADKDIWMKFFLDYFLLTHSEKVYQIVDGLMYKSFLPMAAAWHGKIPFIVKDYNELYAIANGKTEYMYEKLNVDKVCTVDVNYDINSIGSIFTSNHHETIFVIDSEMHLQGIITMGDFFRKATVSKNASELLNKNYKKIKIDSSENIDYIRVGHIADEIFNNSPAIIKLPVVYNSKLLYVVDRRKKVTNT